MRTALPGTGSARNRSGSEPSEEPSTLCGVLIEDSFTVPTPVDRLWTAIQDVEAIAPCMPGAELTEVVDERTWKGTLHVRFGPVQMAFSGTVVMEERDDAARRARLSARGTERRGRGAATATIESWLEPGGDGITAVRIRSDITLTGAAAQLSRGLLPEISKLLVRRFAECLEARLAQETGAVDRATGSTDRPRTRTPTEAVGALGLGVRALWTAIVRLFARLFGRRARS